MIYFDNRQNYKCETYKFINFIAFKEMSPTEKN